MKDTIAKRYNHNNQLSIIDYQSKERSGKLIMTIESQPVKNLSLSMRLQKTLKMTNKAILKIDQLNVTNVLTTDYNRVDTWYRGKNKAILFHKASKIGIEYLKTE